MAQVYGIPQYPVYSPLAGIADLYKEYKAIQRQEAQDAYTKEKDARQFSIYDEQNKLKSQEIANKNEQFLAEQAIQGLSIQERARIAEEENKLRYAPQDCTGAHANTPACIQAMAMKNYRASAGQGDQTPPELLDFYKDLQQEKMLRGTAAQGIALGGGTLSGTDGLTGAPIVTFPGMSDKFILGRDGTLMQLGQVQRQNEPAQATYSAPVDTQKYTVPNSQVLPMQPTRGLVKQRQYPEFGGVR